MIGALLGVLLSAPVGAAPAAASVDAVSAPGGFFTRVLDLIRVAPTPGSWWSVLYAPDSCDDDDDEGCGTGGSTDPNGKPGGGASGGGTGI